MAPGAAASAAWDEQADFVIVGSGAGSICAALAVTLAGKRPLILEKTELVGGSTAMSGGVLWLPNNPVSRRAGVVDTPEAAWTYLEACAQGGGPGASEARRRAFLDAGPRVVEFLEGLGVAFVHAEGYADYHEGELPGGQPRGRSLVAPVFDLQRLGAWADRLRGEQGNLPITTADAPELALFGANWRSRRMLLTLAARMARNALLGHRLVGTGTAVQGRLLEIALRHGVPIRTSAGVRELVLEDGRVVGVELDNGRRICARGGVLVNAGGFSHNAAMRARYQPPPGTTDWTNANPGDTGEMLQAMMRHGAAVDLMDLSWWVTVSKLPGGGHGLHPLEISKPHSIVVDSSGQRFANESTSYLAFGEATYRRNATVPAIPAWAILESRHRKRYPWANHPPGKPPAEWLASGYMRRADTIEDLAVACGIDPQGLRATVDRFNCFADSGVDKDFGRGTSAYARWMADPRVTPNGNLGRIERGPFYAVALYPGDVGTAGGVITDEHGRVLREDGTPIAGLYATGNITAPVVGRSYPGAGASIAASMVFAHLAATHALAETSQQEDQGNA